MLLALRLLYEGGTVPIFVGESGMSVNDMSLGYNPIRLTQLGQRMGSVDVFGGPTLIFPRGEKVEHWQFRAWLQAGAMGGAAAGSREANEFLARQLEEIVPTRDQQPVYIKWSAARALAHDGWYILEGARTNYQYTGAGRLPVDCTVSYVSPGSTRRVNLGVAGGPLPSTYTGSAVLWIAVPNNATVSFNQSGRVGAEGTIAWATPPVNLNPIPVVLSSVVGDIWKGSCRIYDTINTATNPVPLAGISTTGTAVSLAWVEVKGIDHVFQGDMVVYNGLHLWLLQQGQSPGLTGYFWNSITSGWQQVGTLAYQDSSATVGALRQASLIRVGPEELVVDCVLATLTPQMALLRLRLQRGARTLRIDFRPLTENNTTANGLSLTLTAVPKIVYSETQTVDVPTQGISPPITNLYGYAAAAAAPAGTHGVFGLLWQNAPNTAQPQITGTSQLGIGDSALPLLNTYRAYGVFALPFANANKTQAEAETATLAGGFATVTDVGASGGTPNALKLPSGTAASTSTALFGSWTPQAGVYSPRFRLRVTATVGTGQELRAALVTSVGNVQLSSLLLTRGTAGVSTAYAWLILPAVTLDGVTAVQFDLDNSFAGAVATTTDWWIDQAVLLPLTLAGNGPQDLYQQWIYDRTTRFPILS